MMTETLVSKTDTLAEIYEDVYPAVASFVSKMGGSSEDAKDIFHDALIIFVEKDIQLENVSAYIVGIAKHLWVRKYKHDSKNVYLDHSIVIPEDAHNPIISKLLRLLESAGKSCLDILQAFYYEKRTAESIAEEFNYSNAHSATVQKHKCLQKLRTFVKLKSLDYESFVD